MGRAPAAAARASLGVAAAPAFDNVLIHVGRHKSASTFLQHAVFPQLTTNLCIDKQALFRTLSEEDFAPERLRRIVANRRRQFRVACLNPERDDLLILSREGLSFPPGGVDTTVFARNLKAAYPQARILCVIREQFDLLVTLYTWETCKQFLRMPLSTYVDTLMRSERATYVLHDEVVWAYVGAFGRENVLVLPYELLRTDREAFIRRIVEFIDPQLRYEMPTQVVNPSYRKRAVMRAVIAYNYALLVFLFIPYRVLAGACARAGVSLDAAAYDRITFRLKKFSRKQFSATLDRIFRNGEEVSLHPEHFEAYAARFASANGEVEAITGLDLSAHGYVTPRSLSAFMKRRRGETV